MTLAIFVVVHPSGGVQVFTSRADAEGFANPLEGGRPVYPAPLEVVEYVAVPRAADFYTRQNGEKR